MKEKLTTLPPIEIGPRFYVCKFSVSSRTEEGGDLMSNIGGSVKEKRIEFDGIAVEELYGAIMDAVAKVVE